MVYQIAFDEMDWQIAPTGARFKVVKVGDRQLRLLEFGRDLDHPQWCLTGHIGYVIEGEMEVEFDHTVVIFRQGDGVQIPAGERDRHRPRARTEQVRLIFVEET